MSNKKTIEEQLKEIEKKRIQLLRAEYQQLVNILEEAFKDGEEK